MTTASATPTTSFRFPIIDFGPFLSGEAADKRRVAKSILDICKGPGFFYLAQHGVPQSQIDAVFAATRQFFDQPLEEKLKVSSPDRASKGYREYGFFHKDGSDTRALPDLQEHFILQRELPPDDPDIVAGNHHKLNKWPDNLPGWKETILGYFDSVDRLSLQIMSAFAIGLKLKEDYFQQFFRKSTSGMKIFHYPAQPQTAKKKQIGLGAHYDDGAVTILLQDNVGGLQVQVGNGWNNVTPITGTFVINIGEIMARWVNDTFIPTPHRVVNLSGRERYSIPFFALPDWDAMITAVPTCRGDDNEAKYPPRRASSFQTRAFRTQNWLDRQNAAKTVVGALVENAPTESALAASAAEGK
jgi:isopenicillin N synthase-like dioxygenase